MNRRMSALDIVFVIAVCIPLAAIVASSCATATLIAVAMIFERAFNFFD